MSLIRKARDFKSINTERILQFSKTCSSKMFVTNPRNSNVAECHKTFAFLIVINTTAIEIQRTYAINATRLCETLH